MRQTFIYCSCAFLVASSIPVLGQQADTEKIKSLFPNAPAVYSVKNEHLTIDVKNAALALSSSTMEEMLFITSEAAPYANKSIYFSGFEEIKDIEAYTLVPNKSKYKKFEVGSIETKDVLHRGIFYDDGKVKNLIFPNVQPGAITSLQYTQNMNEPRLLTPFYFSSYIPTVATQYSVSFPENVSVKWKLLGANTDKITFSETTANGKKTYTWKAENMPANLYEEDAPAIAYYAPHVMVYIHKAVISGKETTYLGDVSHLYDWYSTMLKNINKTDNTHIQNIVKEITRDCKTDKDKVRSIFQWVQSNIRYIAIEDGWGGFIPTDASEVYAKRYGDCKGMANLTREMLSQAGITSHLTWIGTRSLPYIYQEMPAPIADNHMIVSVELDKQTLFLDATDSYVPFGLPSSMIQGKEALIGLGEKKFKVMPVPVVEHTKNTSTDTIQLQIQNKALAGKGFMHLSGYKKTDFEYKYLSKAGTDMQKFLIQYLEKGNDKFYVTTSDIHGLHNLNSNIRIEYNFMLPDYIKTVGNSTYINMNLTKPLQKESIDVSKRIMDKEIEYQYVDSGVVELIIPDGFTIKHLPANVSLEGKDYGFTISYRLQGNKISMNKQLYIKTIMLKKEAFPQWNAMVAQLCKAYQDVLILTKQGV
ncbi:DUF3857 domain-containing protein [Rhodocytophaga aerolata]|uniref:DUF3857 domain-containing protein n=1 Tax=Rhodocytophaga aerolata TaxID=455078 RepID=A0ABT8RBL0_9BACT|nr:DUF3857 domain-containing protein [Rhodocytophaga aerolata]MDO1449482.1 DUF3857 domain-containing protein [Rhodocytophaga aerolata]